VGSPAPTSSVSVGAAILCRQNPSDRNDCHFFPLRPAHWNKGCSRKSPRCPAMPMFRYFLFVGGALLGLLFLADSYFPPPASVASAGDIDRTIIRIHSSRQWPAAMPIDTNVPMPKAVPFVVVADSASGPLADPQAREAFPREALAYAPPTASKASSEIRRRVRSHSRFAARETHRRLASSQIDWFAATW